MTPLAAQDIVAHIMDRLASGLYPPGCRLPTSRELAAELGVHRNTVAKAYRSLGAMGLVSATPGRGTFASARTTPDNHRLHERQIDDRLADAILRARRGNIGEAELRRLIDRHITAIYHAPAPRGAFVECNAEDLQVAIVEIEQQSAIRLAPLALETLAADPAQAVAGFDVVFTSLFHLLEVRELLARVAAPPAIVGIYTQPDERALAEIAQIDPATRVGIVVSNRDGARRFMAQMQTYSQATARVLVKPADEAIVDLARQVDLIVTSRSRAGQIRRLDLSLPLIELAFHISRESANRVIDTLATTDAAREREHEASAPS
jgi:DNA-binding transcriptional regulator YhcF (GntR family)